MTRAYLRLDPAFDERKESYPDGPYAALIATFCLAELQAERGRFRSADYLSRLLGRRGRHVKFLLEHGDLIVTTDGRVYVDGWDEWQEGDWKVAERVARIRNRQRRGSVTPDVTAPVTVDVTVPVTPDRLSVAERSEAERSGARQPIARDGLANLDGPALKALEDRTGHTASVAGDKQLNEYDRLIADHGLDPVLAAFDAVRDGKRMTARQLVWGAVKVLEPFTDPKVATAKATSQRSIDNTQRYLRELRGEAS